MPQHIHFHTQDIDFTLSNPQQIRQWITQTIQTEHHTPGNINYIFCNDTYLHNINLQYLNHDTYTDIITFPYQQNPIESDIYISIPRIRENAKTYQTTFTQELHRVIIHGILHLLGYPDKTPEQAQTMRQKENHYLNQLPKISL